MPTDETKLTVVQANSKEVTAHEQVIRFRGRPMLLVNDGGFDHYVPLRKERFDSIAYPILGGQTRSRMGDVFSYVSNTARDLSTHDHLVLFGTTEIDEEGRPKYGTPVVWDCQDVSPTMVEPQHTVWRSPYAPALPATLRADDGQRRPVPFIWDIAGKDQGVYDDIMQSVAPIIMDRKPDGVIWWVGDGANGKSTLMAALYKLFPGQFSSITVKRLVDGRDTPSLNGTLANIVKESSEGRIDDTEIYKAIGTHENFRVHKFHSQDDVEVRGNLHHIFSANSVPTFNDKGYSARRRTFIIPFRERFESDPTFEQRTFTPETFAHLITELMRYAALIKEQGYKYRWSAVTLAAKADYDTEANNAEEYAKELIAEGVVAFSSFRPVRMDYENWCADNGYVPLGATNLKKAMQALGFERISMRTDGVIKKVYKLPHISDEPLTPLSFMRPELFTTATFKKTEIPKFDEPGEKPQEKKSVLRGEW